KIPLDQGILIPSRELLDGPRMFRKAPKIFANLVTLCSLEGAKSFGQNFRDLAILKQNKNSELAETNLTSALWGPLFTTIFCSPRSLLCHQTFEEGKRDREEKAETATALAVLLLTFPCEISPRSKTQECVCTPQAPSLCLSEADDWSQSRERNRTSQGRTLSKERDCPIIDLWSKKYQVTNESFC
ncbi:hypothetical protein MJT46_010761, partial [Ovis ammon polii x Ovis aries]